ncbi:D-alanyl-D-alanine carboxypeptidase family protein [Helicovermis profundi]|uniref:serine-type D-Ala-D-Ala carboxypeptidase n=1 Tax=Helicovermis profundi TaxID=3065157 RepID=A0AAU9ED24_9FIRM|nr:D-alanyl-D-alanine carboxypeptidase family protein [Clostridia bacterium S502]
MKLFYKIIALTLLMSLFISSLSFASVPEIVAKSAILIDGNTGQILYEKDSHKEMYPASTTKILTALIILENHKLDEIVTIDKDTPFTTGSRIYVIDGEKFTVKELLYAMLLESANDAAVALAKFHSGSVEEFSKVMNFRAKEIGATNSNFVNPNGLPNKEHHSSAYDLALIGKEAMKNETFSKIVSTYKYNIKPTNKQSETRYLTSSNKFLYASGSKNKISYKGKNIDIKYDSIVGIKTGYTDLARQCFVSAIKKDGKYLIAVILKSEGKNIYVDSRTLLDYGVDNYNYVTIFKKNDILANIKVASDKEIPITSDKDINVLISKKDSNLTITKEIKLDKDIKLPYKADQVIGHVNILVATKTIASIPLIAPYEITDKPLLSDKTINLANSNNKISKTTVLFIILKVLLAIIIWRFIMTLINLIKRKFIKRN